MTLEQIRADETLVVWLAKVIKDRRFQLVLQMLGDSHPMRFVDTGQVTPSTAEKKLGMIEGYQLAIERLNLCTNYQASQGPMPTAKFEVPKPDEEL